MAKDIQLAIVLEEYTAYGRSPIAKFLVPKEGLPLGVMRTTTYTKTQFVIMATELPTFLIREELISEGYRNGIDRNDMPCANQSVISQEQKHQHEWTHIEEMVSEDE